MPTYSYSAADRKGATVSGEREAENQKMLATLLKAEGLFLVEAKDKSSVSSGVAGIDVGALLGRLRRITILDKMFFSRNLGVMIAAGLSLTRGLEASRAQTANSRFRKVLAEVNQAVSEGKSFADALRLHEEVFGPLYINMVEVGETTGKLSLVLKLLASQMKKDHDLRKRVQGAMLYPGIIVIALFIMGALMMIYVVPTLTQTIQELGVELPLPTKIVIGASDFISHYGVWVLAGLIAAIIALWRLLKTKKGRVTFDHVILKVPIFGTLIKEFNVARFCRTLSYLMTSGVPIIKSLEITHSVLGNSLFRAAVEESGREIQKGTELHEILARFPHLFQPMVIQMISVGEETGRISNMMLRLAMFFEGNIAETTKNLSTIIEPILMVVIGGVVGFFAIAILQPIYGSLNTL